MKKAGASSNRSKTRSTRLRRCARSAPARLIRCAHWPDSCGPIWVPTRRRNCRYGSRSPGRMGSRRSSPARCRATGSSVRKTPLIRSTSSGCTTTGACASVEEPGPYAPRHLKLGFDEFDYGFQYRRVREGMTDQDPMWTIGRVALWPNGFFLGSHFEWRIPVDDENTLNICWFFARVPAESEPFVQNRVPTWYGPIKDANGRWISSHIINRNVVAWVGQGTIADRSKELLGSSDRGVAMIRNRFFQDMEAVAQGRDPKGSSSAIRTRPSWCSCRSPRRRRSRRACRAPSGRRIRISVDAPGVFRGRPGSPTRSTTSSRMR